MSLIKALVLMSLLAASPISLAAGSGGGYAWANNPTAARYTPDSSFSHNSSGGAISIRRVEKGVYAASFAGLGGGGVAGGHVQVSAYGPGSEYCKVENWDSRRADFVARVRCYTARGAPVDTRYTVSVEWPSQPLRIVPALELQRPSAPVSGEVAPSPGQLTAPPGPPAQSSERTREILPDGRVKITYADGSYKVMGPGGHSFTNAQGQTQTYLYSTQAPPPNPPLPPAGSREAAWLSAQAEGLLSTISQLVGNNQQSIDNYLAAEGGVDVYAQIVKRRVTLNYMVNE